MIRSPIILSLLLLAGCSGGSQQPDAQQTPSALVTLAAASAGNVAETQGIYGAVEQNADSQYTLAAPAEALVSRILVPVGNAVARGQTVVALTASPSTRASYAQNAANARSAQQAYERAQRLRSDGLVSDAEVESARAAAAGAAAQLRALSAQSGGMALQSPGPGFVQSIAVSPGDLVSAGATVATISQAGDLRARFGLDPSQLQQLQRGAGIRVTVPGGGPDVTVPIQSIDPSVDPQTKLASLFAQVPARLGIGAGQTLSGTVTLQQAGDAVTIPYAALLDDGGQPYVYVVQGGIAHRRDVVPGPADGERVAIEKGVNAGDRVVVKGGTALEDGMKVRLK